MIQTGMRALGPFKRIREAAVDVLDGQITKVKKKMQASAEHEGSTNAALSSDLKAKYEKLRAKRRLMERKWKVVVLNNPSPNAFVNGMIPGIVFVNSGLFHFCDCEEEFAMILAHELSHVLCDHTEKAATVRTYLGVFSLMVLAVLDPTGVLSFLGELGVLAMNPLLNLTFSRGHEEEADKMGAELAALACYDPSKFKGVFMKMKSLRRTTVQKVGVLCSDRIH